MSVLCVLLDKKRLYASLLSDIFNVTGHKLLVATAEEKAMEFFQKASPEVLLIPAEDLDFWFKLLEMGHYVLPLIFLEREEEVQTLKAYGLEESNVVTLPFNPIELLAKVVGLAKNLRESQKVETSGFINLLLKLLSLKLTSSIIVQAKESSCTLLVEEGHIKGSTCSAGELSELLSQEITLKLLPFQREETRWQIESNREFFSELFRSHASKVSTPTVEELPQVLPETQTLTEKVVDLEQPVELDSNFYWVGIADKSCLFQRNVYLRIYQKEGIHVPLLINLGTPRDYLFVKTKVEQVLGSIGALRGLILLGSCVEEASGVLALLQANQKIFVICSISIANRLRALGIPQSRIRIVETFPGGRLRLASGDVLKFIPAPFLPEAGSFVVLEENTGRLFTGRFLSSLCTFEEFSPFKNADPIDLVINASVYLPSQEVLKNFIGKLPVESMTSLYPMFGNPLLSQESLENLFSRLERLSALPRSGAGLEVGNLLEACQSFLDFLKTHMEAEEFTGLLEELEQHLHLEEGRIAQLNIQPEALPSVLLGIMHAKKVKPQLMKEAIRLLYASGVPFTI